MEGTNSSAPITELLRLSQQNDPQAREYLFQAVFSHLRRIAAQRLRKENATAALEPTELVNEAYLSLFGDNNREFCNRAHFMAVAAHAMRCILIDMARKRKSAKRNWGDFQVTLSEIIPAVSPSWTERLLHFEDVMKRLEQFDPRAAQIVELRIFVGFTEEEIAGTLGISSRTVKRDYRAAKAWLQAELSPFANQAKGKGSGN
jgi:RNA polymerase sigma factor (TIGR02999 family)